MSMPEFAPFPNLGNVSLDTFRLSYLTVGQSLRIKPCHRSSVQRAVQVAAKLMKRAYHANLHPKFYIEAHASAVGGWTVTRMPADWTYSQKLNHAKQTGAEWLATLAAGEAKIGPARLFKDVDNALSAYRKAQARLIVGVSDANWSARTVVARGRVVKITRTR